MRPTIEWHGRTTPLCGAYGRIVYERGTAWSVNVFDGQVTDWRFALYAQTVCSECQYHADRARDAHRSHMLARVGTVRG